MIAPHHQNRAKRRGRYASGRREMWITRFWPGQEICNPAHDMVCTLPARRDKRSQMGLFQAGEERRERSEPFAHVCTIVLIVGIAPNYATFCSRHDGDASPTRVISAVVRKGEEEEPSLLFFNYVLLPAGKCSCGSFSELSRNCFATHLFLSAFLKERGERTTFRHVWLRRQVWIKCTISFVIRTILSDRHNPSREEIATSLPRFPWRGLKRKLLKPIYLELITAHSFIQNIVCAVHSPPTYTSHFASSLEKQAMSYIWKSDCATFHLQVFIERELDDLLISLDRNKSFDRIQY